MQTLSHTYEYYPGLNTSLKCSDPHDIDLMAVNTGDYIKRLNTRTKELEYVGQVVSHNGEKSIEWIDENTVL